jgi:hypothetical protein
MLIAHGVTKSANARLFVQVSVNNGTSYYSADGDYVLAGPDGQAKPSPTIGTFEFPVTALPMTGWVQIEGANLPGIRLARFSDISTAQQRYFVASLLPINAVKVIPNVAVNMTGGKIYCYVR